MLLSKRSKDQYVTLLKQIIYDNNTQINAESHSVVDDIFLQPGGQVLSYFQSVIYYMDLLYALDITQIENDTQLLSDLQSFFSLTSSQLTDKIKADLDRIAETYSLTRSPGSKATGYVRFFTNANNTLTISVGTEVQSRHTSPVRFKTLHNLVSVPPSYDGTTGLYYVDVAVECVDIGTKGNLQPNRLTVLPNAVSSVVAVTNVLATNGGAEEESNSSLAARIKQRRAGRSLPTIKGYEDLVIGSGYALDVYVATSKDTTYVTRDDSYALDLFVITSSVAAPAIDKIDKAAAHYIETSRYTDQDTYPPSSVPNEVNILLTKQPVLQITSVTVGGNTLNTSEYTLVKDTSGRSRSVSAFDKVKINTSYTGQVVINYDYDIGIHNLQAYLDQAENNVINNNALVRLGDQVDIDVEININIFSDYNQATVQANVEADLEVFFSGGTTTYGETFEPRLLKQRLDRSDVLRVVLNNAGVDKVKSFTISYQGVPISDSFDPNDIQFTRLGAVTWI